MSGPKVAIVGRPNVGKSSLLNWLARKRVSVVDPTAGVTRDRVAYLMRAEGRAFELVDTGGIGVVDADDLGPLIERQIQSGIDEASLVLFVVDAKAGPNPLDRTVADRLRRCGKPILLVANKCDSPKLDAEAGAFLRLLKAPLVTTSVLGDRNRAGLIEAIVRALPREPASAPREEAALPDEPDLKLAIVGRRNVGKSTFINTLVRAERMIVSEVPGTTRDSVDVRFDLDGRCFVAIDTPGVRKRKSLASDVEFYGLTRALRSIRRADVVLVFFDAMQTISAVDKQLVGEVDKQYKPCVFVVNKWDLAEKAGMTRAKWSAYLFESFASMRHVPVAFITARDDVNTKKLINLAQVLARQARTRVPTARLNDVVHAAVQRNHPPIRANREARIYFAAQVATQPPTIVVKCNDPAIVDKSWRRYLLGVLHKELPFPEVPIKVYYRARTSDDQEAAGEPARPRTRLGEDA